MDKKNKHMSEEEKYVGNIVFFFCFQNSHSRLDRPKITSSEDKKKFNSEKSGRMELKHCNSHPKQ